MQFSEILSAGLGKVFGKDRISSVGPFAEEGTITITYRIRGTKGSPEEVFATVSIPWKLFGLHNPVQTIHNPQLSNKKALAI